MTNADLVNEFARSLSMNSPPWNGAGRAEFVFASRGRVVFETADEDLLLYLIDKSLPVHNPQLAERVLRLCGKMPASPVHPGLTPAGELVLLIRLQPRHQNLPDLERGLEQLFALQDRLNTEE